MNSTRSSLHQGSETPEYRHQTALNPVWQPRAGVAYPPFRSLILAVGLFLLTCATCLAAGRQFAVAYASDKAVSMDEFVHSMEMLFREPSALWAGWPFALTLLAILLAHELGHYFACRHHAIHSSYPFFLPAPTLIGTLGSFILIRSPIRSNRALFDVGASGPLVGFVVAIPALLYGVIHAKVIPDLPTNAELIFGMPLSLKMLAVLFRPGIPTGTLLLHPVGRAAWVGLFATSLNLLPAVQLDGGHILRSVSPRLHRYFSLWLPAALLLLGIMQWLWIFWAAVIFGLRFLRTAPVYDETPLDTRRVRFAWATLAVFLLCFMPIPFANL